MHTDTDPTDPGRTRQLGQGLLQRDGLALAGVTVQTHHRPHHGRVRDPPQHRPPGSRVHHLPARPQNRNRDRNQNRDRNRGLRQVLLRKTCPPATLTSHHVQSPLPETTRPARPGHHRLPPRPAQPAPPNGPYRTPDTTPDRHNQHLTTNSHQPTPPLPNTPPPHPTTPPPRPTPHPPTHPAPSQRHTTHTQTPTTPQPHTSRVASSPACCRSSRRRTTNPLGSTGPRPALTSWSTPRSHRPSPPQRITTHEP